MSPRLLSAAVATLALAAIGVASAQPSPSMPAIGLKAPTDFAGVAQGRPRSLALFAEIGKVLEHPRCMNCHPAGERPTQTDAMIPHQPLVVRGDAGFGAAGMHCTTCHHEANFDPARVPGNAKWLLAPIEQAWQGKSLGEICRRIKDPKRNGGKDTAALVKFLAEDDLVGWGWHPGAGRTPAPGSQAQLGALARAWADNGAVCPA